jgi:hypothetical protein
MANEDRHDAPTPIPSGAPPAKARDYQTQVYQSLADLGAGSPDALLSASGDYWKNCQKLGIAPQVTAALIYGAERHRHKMSETTTINEAKEGLMESESFEKTVGDPSAMGSEAPKTAYRYADVSFDRLDDAQKFAGLLEKQASNIGSFVAGTKHGATVTTNAAPDVIAKVLKKHRWKGGHKMSSTALLAAEVGSDGWRVGDCRWIYDLARGLYSIEKRGERYEARFVDDSEYKKSATVGKFKSLAAAKTAALDHHKTWSANHAEEMPRGEGGIQSQIAAKTECHTCIPWIKVKRDPKQHADIATLAKKFGPIKTPRDVYAVIGDDMQKETQEVFLVLALNIHSELMAPAYEVARGQRDRVAVGIDNVMDAASDARCAAFLVAHGHPGGSPEPSPADIKLTRDIRDATPPGRVFVDHLVVGVKTIYSITEKKLYKIK